MIVTFCGHSHFNRTEILKKRLLAILEENIGDHPAMLYLGGYGSFDSFAYDCGKKYKETHPNIFLVFVSPYLTVKYQKRHLEDQKKQYDSILYPEIETVPPKFAIIYRNRYMVERADLLIAYIDHDWGGAYKTYQYAKKEEKLYSISPTGRSDHFGYPQRQHTVILVSNNSSLIQQNYCFSHSVTRMNGVCRYWRGRKSTPFLLLSAANPMISKTFQYHNSLLTNAPFWGIMSVQLRRTVARYGAARYYREESPGFTGQDS